MPLKPPIVMTPTVFSGLALIFALKRTDTASCWASNPTRQQDRNVGAKIRKTKRAPKWRGGQREQKVGPGARRSDKVELEQVRGTGKRKDARVGGKSPFRIYSEESILSRLKGIRVSEEV